MNLILCNPSDLRRTTELYESRPIISCPKTRTLAATNRRLYRPALRCQHVRFMNLIFNSRLVITDSGGIQEETSYLGIPCLTVRENTERPVTITHGTNQLCDLEHLRTKVSDPLNVALPQAKPIKLWDGKTAKRIGSLIKDFVEL